MALTPNMDLNLPIIQETLGPAYAEMNNVAFETIDSHDHTDGNGVNVPSAGININADLEFNGWSIAELESAKFNNIISTPVARSIYVSDGNLFFKDSVGNEIAITVGGAIAASIGNVTNLVTYITAGPVTRTPSVVFSDVSRDFTFFYDTSKQSPINIADIRLYPVDGAFTSYANFITLKTPTALTTSYTLMLPLALPASTSLAQSTTAGVVTFSNTVLNPIFEGLGSEAAPSYSFTGDPDTGMWSSAANTLSLSTGGTNRFTLSSAALAINVPFTGTTGTFSGAVSATTGTFSGAVSASSYGAVSATTGSFSGAVSASSYGAVNATTGTFSGAVTASSINLDSGGAFKVKIINLGALSTSSSGTLNVAHGLTLTNIRGVTVGFYSSAFGEFIGQGSASAINAVEALGSAGTTNVTIQWTGYAGAKNGYAMIYYV